MLLLAQVASAANGKWKPEDPNVLWRFIHDRCEPAALKGTYPPSPCIEVTDAHTPSRGYVVFKDRDGRHQYLLLPLARITGIESPALLAPDAPNYMAAAWTARMYMEAALHQRVPRDVASLVVNSSVGRSQNQLHIHIDCIRPEVHAALSRMQDGITRHWAVLPERLPGPHGRRYIARWVDGATLTLNPFRALAGSLPAGDPIARRSLVLVGATNAQGQPGFILLSTRANPMTGNDGNSDRLQDRQCALAHAATH